MKLEDTSENLNNSVVEASEPTLRRTLRRSAGKSNPQQFGVSNTTEKELHVKRSKGSRRGRPRKDGPTTRKSVSKKTKAGMSGSDNKGRYSYSDLFLDDDQEIDEDVDAVDNDSEYAPSDEELNRRLSQSTRRRKGVSTGTRRNSKMMVADEQEDDGGSTDEDEAGESETEDEEEEDDDLGDPLINNSASSGLVKLFQDENNENERDVYDFDAQSIVSDKRLSNIKKRISNAGTNRNSLVTTTRSTRRSASGKSSNWGSNIYSALAAALKTRADLDVYSNFLKLNILNFSMDNLIAEVCKPSTQHASLFYGVSASLQSLMSRINDHDKVVELLHAFVSRPYDQLYTRIVYLAPIIHQPLFGLNYLSPVTQALETLAREVDESMIIRPAYLLNEDTNVLGLNNTKLGDFGVSITQYNCVTGSGNLGRYVPDIKTLVISSDLYHKLEELIALPPERIYEVALAKAHRQLDDEDNIDISPLEPPNLQRIVISVDGDDNLVGLAILDFWNYADIPYGRRRLPLDLLDNNIDSEKSLCNGKKECDKQSQEVQVQKVLNSVIDWVVLKSDSKDCGNFPKRIKDESLIGQIRFLDAFLVKPNGRPDGLLLVVYMNNNHLPMESKTDENDYFRVYSLVDESKFILEKHGFAPDMPIELEGVHSVDPDDIMNDKALLVVPDLLFDTLKKVMLRELVSSSGTAAAAAVIATSTTDANNASVNSVGAGAMIHCTKFIILDSQRRVPLAIAFDSPVRLTLQVEHTELGVHPFGDAASNNFDSITPSQLKLYESSFKPNSVEYRLVAINGLLFGLMIDDKRVIRKVIELVPARFNRIFPYIKSPSVSAQTIIGSQESCPSNVRIVNDETNSSTVLPAFYYPQYDLNKLTNVISGLTDQLCNLFFDLPITLSLYNVVFRMAQKYMPELLAKQHIEAAEAAAYAEAAANPHAPPPAPVPLPEHWGVCCLCAKELRSANGLLDHEMRHLGLSRFRCGVHNVCFVDRRSWQMHFNEFHGPRTLSIVPKPVAHQTDSSSEIEDDDVGEQEDTPVSGLVAGLATVFNTGLLTGRMEAPQCEKCGDYFLSAEALAPHVDFCDGVSFSLRTPVNRNATGNVKSAMNDDTEDTLLNTTDCDGIDVENEDICVCGVCGAHVVSREKIISHFTSYHLQCILCNEVLRSMEELSYHYHMHLKDENAVVVKPDLDLDNQADTGTKSLMVKVLTCDICANFYGTKYNYYFHQWSEHGVVHPPVDGAPLSVPQPRIPKMRMDDDLFNTSIRRIKCKFCGLVVRVNGKEYSLHLNDVHNISADTDVICRICADLFETPEQLSIHLGETHVQTAEFANAGVQTVFRCTHCDFWGFAKGLLKHALDVHGDSNPAIYECVHCFERFSDKRAWRSHLDKHNERYAHRCMECGRAFRLRPSLLQHMRNHHGDDQGPATCDYCGLTYPKRSSLRYHIFRMHNQELAHECVMCQRRFRLETELRRHVKETHSGAVKCEICHKICANLRCYSQHRQKHFRTRIYQCTDCHTTFKSKLAMKRHIRVEHLQLGPERFECQICGKIVTQIGMHMLIHKEARFECEYCSKRFTKAAYYNEHLRIHRGEQPFECHICQKKFNKKSNLNVHLRFHEKHRDEEGNYLELKPRGRISTMFGDALMSPSDRAARQAAAKLGQPFPTVPKFDVAVGSNLPGAFNCTGPSGAASEAASHVFDIYGMEEFSTNHLTPNNGLYDSAASVLNDLDHSEPILKKQRTV